MPCKLDSISKTNLNDNEKRVYKIPDDFDPIIYKNLNNDLNKLNNDQLIEHYLVFGINENRIYKKKKY